MFDILHGMQPRDRNKAPVIMPGVEVKKPDMPKIDEASEQDQVLGQTDSDRAGSQQVAQNGGLEVSDVTESGDATSRTQVSPGPVQQGWGGDSYCVGFYIYLILI
jgi:hypothetical protein